ncbi:MAG TPA: hypothetical protein VFZ53_14460 [Polyangiaceae bacterium]
MQAQAPGLVPAAPAAEMTPQQAAAAGLGWVDKNHPLYGTPGYVGSTPGSGGAGAAPPTTGYYPTGEPGTTPINQQNQNAQTYSQTPGAAPSNNTTNQGTQDVVRNTYLQSIQKGTAVDTNDPNFRQQADAYAAGQERARRNALDSAAQAGSAAGGYTTGGDDVERRMIDEAMGRNVGQFEAELVGRELQSRREEIQNALTSLRGMISGDQAMALERELAALDAAIKRESLAQTGSLGQQDLNLRDKLGTGALNVDLIRAMLQNQQFGQSFGLDLANSEANYFLRSLGF